MKCELEKEDFWKDPQKAGDFSALLGEKEKELNFWQSTEKEISSLEEERAFLSEESSDFSLEDKNTALNEMESKIEILIEKLKAKELIVFFQSEYDKSPAILTVKSGAGGKDAQDWAEMLLNMYLKYFEKKGFQYRVVYHSPGKEVGLKTADVEVDAPYAYGYLKREHGIHRLVRLSPFNVAGSRETSFASVELCPILKNDALEIDSKDLKIETFRAGGPGGQHVNTTSSAVRITHLPSGITVNCQNERSQNQNKESAMRILKSKIALKMEAERNQAERNIKGDSKEASFGNQIRSYVLHPYTLVKDHRNGFSHNNPQEILNGNLDPFIENALKNLFN